MDHNFWPDVPWYSRFRVLIVLSDDIIVLS